ncbi:MAG: polysaccharide biosynthesis C-terminal domain-containing protein, partial [Lachnospiraceae bacterium]|nr:polysaccharide biosynthesis C-terminal domain-containing protein [Lachnospiraceae bacterium]
VSTFIFFTFGADLGSFVFHDENVGTFIEILSFLCPFLFLTTTLSSIINGLGKTHVTFVITIIGLAIRIFITIKTVPSQGISGYLISLLVSQLIVTGLSYKCYRRLIFKKHGNVTV